MSKSDTPVELIDTDRARKPLGEPDFAGDTPIAALDSETADGDIFALGVYYADSEEYREIVKTDETISGLDVLNFLTSKGMRNTINVWFNLNFDANVVLKALPRENLQDIRIHNSTEFTLDGKTFEITYIPKKCLRISDGNGNSYDHYDASQFTYAGGLEDSAEAWLGVDDGKENDDVDVERFGLNDDGNPNDYIAEKESKIRRYLRVDCRLTAEIFEEIVRTAENDVDPAIPFGKPFSTGYVAADYIRNRSEYKPGYSSEAVQSAAWKTYRGGRFEVVKRGHVGDVAGPDINSAYPAVMSELPDPSTLEWTLYGEGNRRRDISDLSLADVRDFDYGFLKVRVTTDADRPVQPFAVKNPGEGGRVEYPAVDDAEIWVLKDIFEYAEAEGFITDYDLQTAVLGRETDATKYPFGFFKDLYDRRKTLEDNDRGRPAKLLKIVMNSIYGKTCQTTVNHVEPGEFMENADGFEDGKLRKQDIPEGYDLVTDHRGKPYLEYQSAGRLFNPFLATYITGRTRLKLFRGVVDNNLENDVIMLATDCLMFDRDAFEGTDLHTAAEADPDDYAEALGGWDYDYVGDAFVVGSGIYQVDRYDKDETKMGLRGFKDFYSDSNDFDTLREAAEEYADGGIPVTTTRPVTYGDILHKGGKLSEIGRFRESERTLSADMDTKRRWNRSGPSFGRLLEGAEGSAPKVYDGEALE